MAELKTKQTDASVIEFIKSFAPTQKRQSDAFTLLEMMGQVSGEEPKMWGASMIGFGKYRYKSERSKQQGDWPLIGFSPRKSAISLYVYSGLPEHQHLLNGLGKFKMGAACIYITNIEDIDLEVLKSLMLATMFFLKQKYANSTLQTN